MIDFQPIEFLDVWFWGGAVAYAHVASSNSWTDEDGERHLEGNSDSKKTPHAVFAGVVSGANLLFENVSLPPTTTSPDKPRTRYSISIFDENLKLRLSKELVVEDWPLPDDLDPLTFANWSVQAAACGCGLDSVKFYNREQVDFQIQEAIDAIVLANMPTATGLALMVDGAAVVAEVLTGAFSRITVVSQDNGVNGTLRVPLDERVAGASFTIRSSEGGDNGYVAWSITEP